MSRSRSKRQEDAVDALILRLGELPTPKSEQDSEAIWQASLSLVERYQASIVDPLSIQHCPSAQDLSLSVFVIMSASGALQERDLRTLADIGDPSRGVDMVAIRGTIEDLVSRAIAAKTEEAQRRKAAELMPPLGDVPF